MTEQQTIRIEDLEGRIERDPVKNTEFKNKVEIRINPDNPDAVAVYEAKLNVLSWSSDYMEGLISFRRYDKTTIKVPKKKIVSWFPYRTENVLVPIMKEKTIWDFTPWGRYVILFKGKRVTNDTHYKRDLIQKARSKAIVLNPALIDLAFGPIDEQLERNYDKIYGSKP
jgi:hypothetical protein